MQHALYPKRFGDTCPYCGSEEVQNQNNSQPTAEGCSVECRCNDCGRSHHLNYSVTSVTLENNEGIADTDFHYPVAELQDQGVDDPSKALTIPVGVVATPQGVMLMAAGYGDGASASGFGVPVLIEQYNSKLRVVVWSDINDDDVSDIIDLDGAQLSQCNPSQDYPVRVIRYTPNNMPVEEHQFEREADATQFGDERLATIPGHYVLVRDGTQGKTVWDSRET